MTLVCVAPSPCPLPGGDPHRTMTAGPVRRTRRRVRLGCQRSKDATDASAVGSARRNTMLALPFPPPAPLRYATLARASRSHAYVAVYYTAHYTTLPMESKRQTCRSASAASAFPQTHGAQSGLQPGPPAAFPAQPSPPRTSPAVDATLRIRGACIASRGGQVTLRNPGPGTGRVPLVALGRSMSGLAVFVCNAIM